MPNILVSHLLDDVWYLVRSYFLETRVERGRGVSHHAQSKRNMSGRRQGRSVSSLRSFPSAGLTFPAQPETILVVVGDMR